MAFWKSKTSGTDRSVVAGDGGGRIYSKGAGRNLGGGGAVRGLDCGVITRLCQHPSNWKRIKGEFYCVQIIPQ